MNIQAPMSGNVWKIQVKELDQVNVGDVLVILESMKMEIPIEAETAGFILKICVSEGDFTQEGDCLLTMKQKEEPL
ncbi:acetyl-CoA carboxylase biotin carboxyl carrier protein subunit [Microbacteriaceae bacterium 4G12]